MSVPVRMPVSALNNTDELLDAEEGEDAGKRPEPNGDVVRAAAFVTVAVGMRVRVRVIAVAAVRVRRDGVWNEMKKGVAQQTARGER